MIKNFFILSFMLLSGLAYAQPSLMWSGDSVHFQSNCGNAVVQRVNITNVGDKEATITNISLLSGSSDFSIAGNQPGYTPIESKEFALGSSGAIWIDFQYKSDAGDPPGVKRNMAIVQWIGGSDTLFLDGRTVTPVLTTFDTIDFGPLPLFHYTTLYVPIHNSGDGDMSVGFTIDHPAFTIVDPRSSIVLPAGATDSIAIIVEAHSSDEIEGHLQIASSSECVQPRTTVLRFSGASAAVDVEKGPAEFSVYPNPARDILHLQNPTSSEASSAEIFNMLGEEELVVPKDQVLNKSIDVSRLRPGSYTLRLNDGGRSLLRSFIMLAH